MRRALLRLLFSFVIFFLRMRVLPGTLRLSRFYYNEADALLACTFSLHF